MSNLYIDVYSKTEEKGLFKNYKLRFDGMDIGVKIDYDFLNSVCIRQNRKYSLEEIFFLRKLKRIIKGLKTNNIRVLFSNRIYNKKYFSQYISNMLGRLNKIDFQFVKKQNEMLKHDIEIIKRYSRANKLKKENIKILLICSSVSDYNAKKVREYISNYKVVDILALQKESIYNIHGIKQEIDKLNFEYGSCVSVLKPEIKDISKYNVYLAYADVDKNKLDKYLLNNKAKYLNVNNIDEDTLSLGYKKFVKNETIIKNKFKSLKLDIENFSISTLGKSLT